jgi:hypothetical protein
MAYAREYFRNMIFGELIMAFKSASEGGQFSRAELARRSRKRPEQITRWLSSPGNITIDVLSDLLMAMGREPTSILRRPASMQPSPNVSDLMRRIGQPARRPFNSEEYFGGIRRLSFGEEEPQVSRAAKEALRGIGNGPQRSVRDLVDA